MEHDRRILPVIDTSAALPVASGPPPFERIAVIGLGTIGGSVALGARAAWPTGLVIGVDDHEALEDAVRRHAIDVGAPDLSIISGATLIVLARSAAENVVLLGELGDYVEQEAVVTDIGGAQGEVALAAHGLPERLAFVAGRPEVDVTEAGLASARADLFVGRPWVFAPDTIAGVPPDGALPEPLAALFRFVEGLGARPSLVTERGPGGGGRH